MNWVIRIEEPFLRSALIPVVQQDKRYSKDHPMLRWSHSDYERYEPKSIDYSSITAN